MPTIERCVNQGINAGRHLLFHEQWERCKNCKYDPENNKKCPGYSPTSYNIKEKETVIFNQEEIEESTLHVVRA